jgi:cytochrome c oxidase subunit 1
MSAAKMSALLIWAGFNFTFFPQFLLGYMGMPRRYHSYPEEFQVLNVMSTTGASVLAIGYLLPVFYLTYSAIWGKAAGRNPWGAVGLEWQIQSPPITFNFPDDEPIVITEAYDYENDHILDQLAKQPQEAPVV